MKFIEILRLIVQIWPLIEKILGMIEDDNKKKKAEDVVAKAISDIIKIV